MCHRNCVKVKRSPYRELLPELRLVVSVGWSAFSSSEVEADDDWDDTDSLLPIEVSSAVKTEPSPAAENTKTDNKNK